MAVVRIYSPIGSSDAGPGSGLDAPSANAHEKLATLVNISRDRQIMKLTFLGKDRTPNDSPTLYETDREI